MLFALYMTRCGTITFVFIPDCYTIKFTETLYETKKKTEFLKVNLNMKTGIPIWHI